MGVLEGTRRMGFWKVAQRGYWAGSGSFGEENDTPGGSSGWNLSSDWGIPWLGGNPGEYWG